MRKTAVVLSIMFLAGCGDSVGPASIAGTWEATSINGDLVPGWVTWWAGQVQHQFEVGRFVMVFNEDGSGTGDFDGPRSIPIPPLSLTWTSTSGGDFSVTLSTGSVITAQLIGAGRVRMTGVRNWWVMNLSAEGGP